MSGGHFYVHRITLTSILLVSSCGFMRAAEKPSGWSESCFPDGSIQHYEGERDAERLVRELCMSPMALGCVLRGRNG